MASEPKIEILKLEIYESKISTVETTEKKRKQNRHVTYSVVGLVGFKEIFCGRKNDFVLWVWNRVYSGIHK